MTKLSRKKVEEALKNSFGVFSVIAQRCKVERSTITDFFHKHPDLRAKAEAERDKIVDIAEIKLNQKLNEGDSTLIWKVLSTKGKNRGYEERKEQINITNEVNEGVVYKFVVDDGSKNNKPVRKTTGSVQDTKR